MSSIRLIPDRSDNNDYSQHARPRYGYQYDNDNEKGGCGTVLGLVVLVVFFIVLLPDMMGKRGVLIYVKDYFTEKFSTEKFSPALSIAKQLNKDSVDESRVGYMYSTLYP